MAKPNNNPTGINQYTKGRGGKASGSSKKFRETLAIGRAAKDIGDRNAATAAVRRLRGSTVSSDSRMTAGWARSVAGSRDSAVSAFGHYRSRGIDRKTALKYAKADVREYARHSPEAKIAASFAFRKPPRLIKKRK